MTLYLACVIFICGVVAGYIWALFEFWIDKRGESGE